MIEKTTWTCKQCGASGGDALEACWKCGTPRTAAGRGKSEAGRLRCVQCDRDLEYIGTKAFHEGTRWGVFGELAELFVNKERLDLYCCPRCGRVEFFVDGVGEEMRGERQKPS